MTRQLKKIPLRWVVASILGLISIAGLTAGVWALSLQLTGNVHVVETGVLYRSAQLNGGELADVLSKYRIRSVVNLRGENRGETWYENELKVTAAHKAVHFDVGMGATSEPEPKVIAKLVKILRTAPRPILIHCYSGADRSGLAAAIYERIVAGKSAQGAARQLSFRYGHFPWLGSGTIAMDEAYWRLSAKLVRSEQGTAFKLR